MHAFDELTQQALGPARADVGVPALAGGAGRPSGPPAGRPPESATPTAAIADRSHVDYATAMSQPLKVKPGTKVHLADFSRDYHEGLDKSDGIAEGAKHAAALDELAYRLYAEHRRALLVVLQGMDTSGKDGTIRHVMSGVSPSDLQGRLVQAAQQRRTRARFPLARSSSGPAERANRHLQSLALRRRARRASP